MLFSSRVRLFCTASALLLTTSLLAQQSGAPSSSPGPTGGNTPSNPGSPGGGVGNTRGTYGNVPNQPFPGTTPRQMETPIFLSGRVVFDDGSQPNNNIRVERVCGTDVRLEGHTDSKGRFSFQLGQNIGIDTDASVSNIGGPSGMGMPQSSSGNSGVFGSPMGGFPGGRTALWNCELRASYPGYRSDVVRLAGRQPMDPPDLGVIVLHHLGAAAGTTVSITTALAPKNAQKAYQKGLQLVQKGKTDEAIRRLTEATELYPKYAIAWYALGQAQQQQGNAADARKSYEAALAADSRYVNPYDQLARLAAQEGNWEQAARYSKQAISLNPVEFPSSFWYNAIANYQLKKSEDAEKSVRDLLKLDTRHNYPQAEGLMGQLLLDKGNYPDAATHLQSYLKLVPNANNADQIKQLLLKIQGGNALTKAAPATVPPQQ